MQTIRNCILLLTFFLVSAPALFAQKGGPFTIENYYQVKWGYATEWLSLYKKNHLPLLKKLQEKGDILDIQLSAPRFHNVEAARWDYKVTITFKTADLALDFSLTEPFKKQLYPDQATYAKEEQRRFELLTAHWDVPVEILPLDK